MSPAPAHRQSFLAQHVQVVKQNRGAAIGLAGFCVAMAVGIWVGTAPLESQGLRVFCVVLGVVTMIVCGIGYLFPGEDEAESKRM